MAHDEASKNHPGGVHDSSSNEKEARMHESAKSNDGYKVLKLFLEKINPNIRSQMLDLKNMMKKISKVAGFSTINTNHSIRVTAITLWSNGGVPDRHIMSM
ncbi:unnamed protein product, partial [Porites lobata]